MAYLTTFFCLKERIRTNSPEMDSKKAENLQESIEEHTDRH